MAKSSKTRSGTILLNLKKRNRLIIILFIAVFAVPLPFRQQGLNIREGYFYVQLNGTLSFQIAERKTYCNTVTYKYFGTIWNGKINT
jgi:hypothetical protein